MQKRIVIRWYIYNCLALVYFITVLSWKDETVIFNVEDGLRIIYNMKSNTSHIYPTFESNVCEINVHSSILSGRKLSKIYRFLKHCSGKDAKLLMLLTGMGKINSANLLTTFKLQQVPLLFKTKSHGKEAGPPN